MAEDIFILNAGVPSLVQDTNLLSCSADTMLCNALRGPRLLVRAAKLPLSSPRASMEVSLCCEQFYNICIHVDRTQKSHHE